VASWWCGRSSTGRREMVAVAASGRGTALRGIKARRLLPLAEAVRRGGGREATIVR